jgi:glycosyltransferase involved in cell wall biosynthesis
MSSPGPRPRIGVVIPTLDTPDPLLRVLAELQSLQRTDLLVVVVDDGSDPPIPSPGVHSGIELRWARHPNNLGYGAAQKTGFAIAMAHSVEYVVLLHGDGQYNTQQTLALIDALIDEQADFAMGSRFLPGAPSPVPHWRRWGNHLLTSLANRRFTSALSELHSGARAYRASALASLPLEVLSDDFVFDHQVLAAFLHAGLRWVERPVLARYDDTVRSISFRRSIRYGLGCLITLVNPPILQTPGPSPRRR